MKMIASAFGNYLTDFNRAMYVIAPGIQLYGNCLFKKIQTSKPTVSLK